MALMIRILTRPDDRLEKDGISLALIIIVYVCILLLAKDRIYRLGNIIYQLDPVSFIIRLILIGPGTVIQKERQ
jgi:hypothetical protein